MHSVEEIRARLEAGWPDALTVSPEELHRLRAHDRGHKLKAWAVVIAVPLLFLLCVAFVTSLERRAPAVSPVYEPPPSTPSAYVPPRRGTPTFFKVDRDLELQLAPSAARR